MYFKSRYDGLYLTIINVWAVAVMAFAVGLFIEKFIWVGLLLTFIVAFVLSSFYTTRLVITETQLIVFIGVFTYKIKLSEVKEIIITNNSISSFATSVRRIGLRLGRKKKAFGYSYVSPRNENKFIELLKERCKNLEDQKKDA